MTLQQGVYGHTGIRAWLLGARAGTAAATETRLHARENFRRIVKPFLGLRR